MIKSIVIVASLLVSSIVSAHTLNMAPMSVTANVQTINMESVTIVGHAKAKRHMSFSPVIINVKAPSVVKVARAFASARFTPCESFTRLDGITLTICGGRVTHASDTLGNNRQIGQ